MEGKTTIELTKEDALLFTEFQKRYQFIKLLNSLGAFELKNGQVIINFTNLGEVASVDIQKHIKVNSGF